jgi:hypothetical protein
MKKFGHGASEQQRCFLCIQFTGYFLGRETLLVGLITIRARILRVQTFNEESFHGAIPLLEALFTRLF